MSGRSNPGLFPYVTAAEFSEGALNAGEKIRGAVSSLPSTGGAVFSSFDGVQAITADPFTGITKPALLILGAGLYEASANITIPSNVTVRFDIGARLTMAAGKTLTINGRIEAGRYQIFGPTGTIVFSASGKRGLSEVPVEWFGAVSGAVIDSTLPTQRALDACGASSKVTMGMGDFLWSSRVKIQHSRVDFSGAEGSRATRVIFTPTANDTALEIKSAAVGGAIISEGSVRNICFFSDDSTYVKVAIDEVDISTYLFDNIVVAGSVAGLIPDTYYWGDVTRNSVGLRTNGREAVTFRKSWLVASKPIEIAINPNHFLSIDHYHFTDVYLLADANWNVTVNTGVNLNTVIFDGTQPWVKGIGGLRWVDTTSAGQSESLILKNVRWEQPESVTGEILHIEHNVNLRNLIIENMRWGNGALGVNGISLRKVIGTTLTGVQCDSPGVALDMDASCVGLDMRSVTISHPGGTVSIPGVKGVSGSYYLEGIGQLVSFLPTTPNAAGTMVQRFNPSATLGFNQFEPDTITVPANTIIKLGSNALSGLLLISTLASTVSALVGVNGPSNSTRVLSFSDAGWWGAAAAAANHNIYAAGGEYKLQNNTASPETYKINFFGAGER